MKLGVMIMAMAFAAALSAGDSRAAESASNGIYGGYAGSDRWFSAMRQSAANRAMLESIAGTRSHKKLPSDYVEFAGQILFPDGNPFPEGRLPDLCIEAGDKTADPVERAPYVESDGSFYTVFRKGVTYELSWMYYFGGREKFAVIDVRPDGPPARRLAIEYRAPKPSADAPSQRPATPEQPAAVDRYEPPRAGEGYKSPAVGPGFKSPSIGPGYRSPGSN